jgi:hypothetical protein
MQEAPYSPDEVGWLDGLFDGVASVPFKKHRQAAVKQKTTTNDLIVEEKNTMAAEISTQTS